MKEQLSLGLTGITAVLVGYASAAIIVFQAAQASGADASQVVSWLWALGIGMGAATIGLSLYYRSPILIAWSTPGAALLVTSLGSVSLNEAIAGFIFSSALITVFGLSGWIDRLAKWIPSSLAAAMLAGVLLKFVLGLFGAMEAAPIVVIVMLIFYVLGRTYWPSFNVPLVFLVGIALFVAMPVISWVGIDLSLGVHATMDSTASSMLSVNPDSVHSNSLGDWLAYPVWMSPEWSMQALMSVGIPLFIVTMCSQNLPGMAVLRANGFNMNPSLMITTTGVTGLLFAPFGGFAFNLAAITAAMCMGPEVHSNRGKWYMATVWAGAGYIMLGIFATSVTSVLTLLPVALVAAIAGIALLNTFGSSLSEAIESRELSSLITFLVTASGMSLLGVGSAFWGIVLGLMIVKVEPWLKSSSKKASECQ